MNLMLRHVVALAAFGCAVLRAQSNYATPYFFTTLAGTTGQLSTLAGVAVDGVGNIYIAENYAYTIRKVTSTGVVTTLAGAGGMFGSADGAGDAARFGGPQGLAVDGAGNVFVADRGNHTIRKITGDGVVSTVAGTAGSYGSADGTGSAARFYFPAAVAVDSEGNVFVADGGNHTIRKITGAGVVTTLAGTAGSSGSADGTGGTARFFGPNGVAVDRTGNLYVADTGNLTIRKITGSGMVTTLAGMAGGFGSADGAGGAARFKFPAGLAVDREGNLYVTETGNYLIRRITSDGVVTTLAGMAGFSGAADGSGSVAKFAVPVAVAVDGAGTLYVADNLTIREGVPATTGLARFATQPVDQAVLVDGGARFMVLIDAADEPTLRWQVSTDGGGAWANVSDTAAYAGAATNVLTLVNSTLAMTGRQFRCVAANASGTAVSQTATLTVSQTLPAFQLQPVSAGAVRRGNLSFRVEVTGAPVPTLQWQLSTNGGGTWTDLLDQTIYRDDAINYTGTKTPTLGLSGVLPAADGNQYRCVATNGAGSTISAVATLTFYPPPANDDFANAPLITGTNAVVTGTTLGSTMESNEPDFTGYFASPSIWWKWVAPVRGSAVLDPSGSSSLASLAVYTGSSLNALTLVAPGSGSSGSAGLPVSFVTVAGTTYWIRVKASNVVPGSIVLNVALTEYVLPSFTTQPAGITAMIDGGASFSAAATGVPVPTLRWQVSYNGGANWFDLSNANPYSGVTTGTLAIAAPLWSLTEGYLYRCVATSAAGTTASNAALLTVNEAPNFYQNPTNQAATAGYNATFTAGFRGLPKPALRWQVSTDSGGTWVNLGDSAPYAGTTTDTLSLTGASLAMNAYQYRCVATNGSGTATSNAATLAVVPLATNDDFAQAILLPGSVAHATGSNVATTKQSGEPDHAGNPGGHSVWWRWVAPAVGQVALDTAGTSFANLLAVYSGNTVDELTSVAASSSYGPTGGGGGGGVVVYPDPGAINALGFNAVGGTTYWIAVDGYGGNTGVLTLNLTFTAAVASTFTTQPLSQTVMAGGRTTFTAAAGGTPVPFLQWQVSSDGGGTWSDIRYEPPYSRLSNDTLTISGVSAEMAGYQYRCVATNIAGPVASNAATLNVVFSSRVVNLSVRSAAGAGSQTLIVGFVMVGEGNKALLLRGIGPTLSTQGVAAPLADPGLRLLNSIGGAAVATNDDWGGSGAMAANFAALGAFALPADSKDAALYQVIPSGLYSLHLVANAGTGVALAEFYDGDMAEGTAKVVNVSARTQVGTGENVLIAGFVIAGNGPKAILLRGLGPSLAPAGVTGELVDPQIYLFGSNGLIGSNDNWGGTQALKDAFAATGAGALISDTSKDAALLVTLQPGVYSAQVSGVGGTTGVGLVEIFLMP
jgi:sugar lactone lactonase YvrE